MSSSGRMPAATGFAAAFFILSAGLVGAMFVVPYLPTNDGPEWVFATHIENHYSDPSTPYYAGTYIPALQFASRGFALLYGPLEAALGWQRGLQVALSCVALLVAWGFAALILAIDRRRAPLAFLGFPVALGWSLYMGFWSFTLSLGAGLLVLALAVRWTGDVDGPSRTQLGCLGALLLLVAVTHVFGAALIGTCLVFLFAARAPAGRKLGALGRVFLVGLPAGLLAVAAIAVSRGAVKDLAFARDVVWLSPSDTLALLPQTFFPGPLSRALVATVALLAAAVMCAVRCARHDTGALDRGLGFVALLFLLATVFAPVDVPGWQFLSQRFATPGIAFALAVLPFERLRPAAQRIAAGTLFSLAALSLVASYPMHRRLAARVPDAIAGLGAPIHRTGSQLPVALAGFEGEALRTLAGEVPFMNPLLHIGALYATAEGGLIPYVFASSGAIHPFVVRPDDSSRPVPKVDYYWGALRSDEFHTDASFRRDVEEDLASYGMLYDGVVVVGARAEDVALWRARGFVADWAQGATFLGHFVPCGLDVTAASELVGADVIFDLGWGRLVPIEGMRVRGRAGADGLAHFLVPPAPCGDVRIRAVGSAPPRGGVPLCGNADATGTLQARLTRDANRVLCTDARR